MERARQDPEVRVLVEDVRLFDGLREHVGWRRLHDKVRGSRHGFALSLSRRLMAGEKVTAEEISFSRGFYEGALWIIEQPEKVEQQLERTARRAWVKAQLEIDSNEGVPSLYG